MPATQAPPAAAPTIAAPAPKPGPSAIAVNMPAPPSMETAPADAPGKSADILDFDKYARPAEEVLTTPNAPRKTSKQTVTPKQDAAKPPDKPAEPADPAEPKPGEEPKPAEAAEPTEPVKGEGDKAKGKVNPWKWGEEHKAARLKLEQEVAELRKLIPNEVEAKAAAERLTAAEKRAQEYEDHLRFLDYQKHPEFQTKYQKPYDDKWNSIMRRISGVEIRDAHGNSRKVQPSDIQKIGALPANEAIELAESMFGKLGNWVAERVEELKDLDEARFNALETAKKEGRSWHEQTTARQKEISEFLAKTWKQALDDVKTHSKYGKYFNEVEADEEFNTKLAEGYRKVDDALQGNPADPNLTSEQREKLVRRTAGLRNRAAAFGVLNLTISRLESQLAEANAKLAEYEASTPKTEGQQPNANGTTPPEGYSMDRFEQALAARARPGVV